VNALILHAPSASELLDAGPTQTLNGLERSREVLWGQPWQAGTAAYWIALTKYASPGQGRGDQMRHRLGATLREEVAACILGGFGMPFEIGLAAFHAVKDAELLVGVIPTASRIEAILRQPLLIGSHTRSYRFPRQRAQRLSAALAFLEASAQPEDPLRCRDWLVNAPGIGLKTASWAVRNHFGCDQVAIIDIHILRAGIVARVFDPGWRPPRDYRLIEAFFLAWAGAGSVPAGDLDAVIWMEQAAAARAARKRLSRTPQDKLPFGRII
jgi:thermostable 8-oxoguanine DNA glycosylase